MMNAFSHDFIPAPVFEFVLRIFQGQKPVNVQAAVK